jgi:hypothetical protein
VQPRLGIDLRPSRTGKTNVFESSGCGAGGNAFGMVIVEIEGNVVDNIDVDEVRVLEVE